jgi:hypothetical protein
VSTRESEIGRFKRPSLCFLAEVKRTALARSLTGRVSQSEYERSHTPQVRAPCAVSSPSTDALLSINCPRHEAAKRWAIVDLLKSFPRPIASQTEFRIPHRARRGGRRRPFLRAEIHFFLRRGRSASPSRSPLAAAGQSYGPVRPWAISHFVIS